MIMYFDFDTYGRMCRLALREKNPAGRRLLLFVVFCLIPAVSTLNAICFFLDAIVFPGLRGVEVRTPVFILGHARSGTTLMHRLMSMDGERFSYFMLYEMLFPSLLQRKAIRAIAAFDRRFLGGRLERRMQAWDERLLGPMRQVHPTSFTAPEEDDDILTFSCASGVWMTLFPYMDELDFYHVDERPARRRRRLMRYYRACIQRQLYLNGTDKIHLSKNPTFSGRVESLIETFPDARIVVMARNPNETIPSLLKLLQGSWRRHRWERAEMERSLRITADISFHTYEYPFQALARHPETKHAVIDYRDLVAHPRRAVEQAYADLGFPVSDELDRRLRAEEQRARSHETTHTYSLEEFGLRADEIRTRLAGLFERFGWDESGQVEDGREPAPGSRPAGQASGGQALARGERSSAAKEGGR